MNQNTNKKRPSARSSFINGKPPPGHLHYKLKDAIDKEDLDAVAYAFLSVIPSGNGHKRIMENIERYKEPFKTLFEKKSQRRVQDRCSQFRLELMERTWDPSKPMNLWKITENMKWILENE